jgi:hypothetical protein
MNYPTLYAWYFLQIALCAIAQLNLKEKVYGGAISGYGK